MRAVRYWMEKRGAGDVVESAMVRRRRDHGCRALHGVRVRAVGSPSIQPLRTAPAEKLTVNPGFRDWGPATVAGTTILAGNQTGRGGLFAVDMLSGKVKWTHRPVFSTGTASVSTPPAVSGDIVITPLRRGLSWRGGGRVARHGKGSVARSGPRPGRGGRRQRRAGLCSGRRTATSTRWRRPPAVRSGRWHSPQSRRLRIAADRAR